MLGPRIQQPACPTLPLPNLHIWGGWGLGAARGLDGPALRDRAQKPPNPSKEACGEAAPKEPLRHASNNSRGEFHPSSYTRIPRSEGWWTSAVAIGWWTSLPLEGSPPSRHEPVSQLTASRAAAPAWGCEARLELDAAGSVNRLKASRVGALPNPRNPSGCLQEQFLTTRLLFGIPISIPK